MSILEQHDKAKGFQNLQRHGVNKALHQITRNRKPRPCQLEFKRAVACEGAADIFSILNRG